MFPAWKASVLDQTTLMMHNTGGWIRTNILQFWRLLFYQLNYTHRTTVTGFEPIPCESKSHVLPLHHTAISTQQDSNL